MTQDNSLAKKVENLEDRIMVLEKVVAGFLPPFTDAVPETAEFTQDSLYEKAVELVQQYDRVSASLLQRRLKIGYARTARLLDSLEVKGIVGPAEGSKPREVYKKK